MGLVLGIVCGSLWPLYIFFIYKAYDTKISNPNNSVSIKVSNHVKYN